MEPTKTSRTATTAQAIALTAATLGVLPGLQNKADAETITNWTSPTLVNNGAPMDSMDYGDGTFSVLGTGFVGNGQTLSSFSAKFSKGNLTGDLNGGSFDEVQWSFWLGSAEDFDGSSPNFNSYIVKTFSAPTAANLDGNISGLDVYNLDFSFVDKNIQLTAGKEYIGALFGKGLGETAVMGWMVPDGPEGLGHMPGKYTTAWGSGDVTDLGYYQMAARIDTDNGTAAVPLPNAGIAAGIGIGGLIASRSLRRRRV